MSWRNRNQAISPNKAIQFVQECGILLVYPIANHPEPPSLWSQFFPRSKMRWVWDAEGDIRVLQVWDLREKISRTKDVVYAKWYRDRATFFSRSVFVAMLSNMHEGNPSIVKLSPRAEEGLQFITENSPITTKQIKQTTKKEWGWENKHYESVMKELWRRLLIVGCGEVDDGAFPSLNVAAAEVWFEDLWKQAHEQSKKETLSTLSQYLPEKSLWNKYYVRLNKAEKKTSQKGTVRYEELLHKHKKR